MPRRSEGSLITLSCECIELELKRGPNTLAAEFLFELSSGFFGDKELLPSFTDPLPFTRVGETSLEFDKVLFTFELFGGEQSFPVLAFSGPSSGRRFPLEERRCGDCERDIFRSRTFLTA